MGRPSVLDHTNVTKDHWETIQQWRIDEGKNFARSRSNAISRMSASGMKKDGAVWETTLAKIDEAYEAEKKADKGSATQGILNRWTAEMKEFYVKAAEPIRYQTSGKNDEEQAVYNSQRYQLKKSGQENPYRKFTAGGGTEKDWYNLSTEEFMANQFGYTEEHDTFSDASGEQAAASVKEEERQRMKGAQTQTASPWWG